MSKPLKKPFTADDAKEWLHQLELAHIESINLLQCALWAIKACDNFNRQVSGEGNVYSFAQKRRMAPPIAPYPDEKSRPFAKIGRALDDAFHQLNVLLPDLEDKS